MLSFIKRSFLTILFLIAEAILFVFIIFVNPSCVRILQWVSILLCFLFALKVGRKLSLINLALLLTVVADGFLVLPASPIQIPGTTFFAFVSITYFLFLFLKESGKIRKIHLFSRIFLIIVVLVVAVIVLKDNTDYLSLISVFYFTNLVLNIVFSFATFRKNMLLSLGLILFALCDIVVGLVAGANIYIPVKEGGIIDSIINAPINLSWFFYIPSQVIIALYNVTRKGII